MKKKIGLIIIILFIVVTSFTYLYINKQKTYTIEPKISKELLYKGYSNKWAAEMNIDDGKQIEINIKYIGAGEPPNLINVQYEELNGDKNCGALTYGKTLSGYCAKASTDKITGIKRKNLLMVIKWDNKEEKIEMKKITEAKSSSEVVNNSIKNESLTEEEYIQKLAEAKKISLSEAKDLVEQRKKENRIKYREFNKSNGSEIYRQVEFTDVFLNSNRVTCEITSGFLATIYVSNSFAQVTAVENSYVIPSGSENFIWVNGNQVSKIIKNGMQVYFTAAGAVESTVSESVSRDFSQAGFNVYLGSDRTAHVSKHYIVDHSYYPNEMKLNRNIKK